MLADDVTPIYFKFDRFDFIYGTIDPPVNACENCKSYDCEGKKECKGFGAYTLGISIK